MARSQFSHQRLQSFGAGKRETSAARRQRTIQAPTPTNSPKANGL